MAIDVTIPPHLLRQAEERGAAALARQGSERLLTARKHPFDYHRPNEAQIEQISEVRAGCKALHGVLLLLPAGPERTLAIRKLEECSMWSNKAVIMADEGPVDDGK